MNVPSRIAAVSTLLWAFAGPTLAAPVTWGVNVSFSGGTTISGTVHFDDAMVAGFYDGIDDPNDTHVDSDFRLTSAALGLSDALFSSRRFKPYYYLVQQDGPHVDDWFYFGPYVLTLDDSNSASLFDGQSYINGTWSVDRAVPVPATLALTGLGLALLGVGRSRRVPQR